MTELSINTVSLTKKKAQFEELFGIKETLDLENRLKSLLESKNKL